MARGIHRPIARAFRVKQPAKVQIMVVEYYHGRGCSIIIGTYGCVVYLAPLVIHIYSVEGETAGCTGRRTTEYLIVSLLRETLPIKLHMLRQLAYGLLDIDVKKDGDLPVDHVRVVLFESFFESKHYRLIDAIKQVTFIGKDHDHVIMRIRSLCNLIDPTCYILYIMLV